MPLKFNDLRQKVKQLNIYLHENKSILYFSTTAFFILAMLSVLIHGFMIINNIGFEIVEIGIPQPLATNEITITNLAFNPKTKLHRMDIFLSSTDERLDFFNHTIEVVAIAQTDVRSILTVHVVRVTNQFYVLYVTDLEPNFGALRKDITYFSDQFLNPVNISLRTREEQSTVDYSLTFEANHLELMPDALQNDVRIATQKTKTLATLIMEIEEKISANLSDIDQTKSQMAFEVGSNLDVSRRRIEALLNQNVNYQNEISELETEILKLLNEINLLLETLNEL